MAHERILIVDGDITLSEMLRNRLKAMGYLVDCAFSGNDALSILKSRWVDLIVLAIVLQGGMHGFQLFREIKNRKKFAQIPIIIHSNKPAMKEMFEMMGAEAFFIKAHSLDLVLDKIKDILRKEA